MTEMYESGELAQVLGLQAPGSADALAADGASGLQIENRLG